MKKRRGTPARRKRPASKSTALVRRRPKVYEMEVSRPGTLPATLTSDPLMVSTFVGTLTLEPKQTEALRRPVTDDEIDWRPAVLEGPPIIPYLSHNGYRDRLDAAFGLGGWGMVPVGQPKSIGEKFIYVPYALVVGGVPRVYTWGEQQIHSMTYGDALEGAKSNAIVRCGKELGIARDLWNKKYVEALLRRKGSVPADGSTRASSPGPRAGYNANDNEPITQKQRQRLWVIVRKSARSEAEISVWMKAVYNLDSTKKILRKDYDAICTAIEKPGSLPMPEEA